MSVSGASISHLAFWHAICLLAALSQHYLCCQDKTKPSNRQLACCVSRQRHNLSGRQIEREQDLLYWRRHHLLQTKKVPWLYFIASCRTNMTQILIRFLLTLPFLSDLSLYRHRQDSQHTQNIQNYLL